jgi:dihydrofolate synthase/folylpolyglutamate synthase
MGSQIKHDATGLPAQLAEIKPAESYEQALATLAHLPNLEHLRPDRIDVAAFRLARMHALLERLGDPQRSLRCVHVAGSKGKGSICEMMAAALGGCGYTVGLYTSPHLVDVRERVRVSGRWIEPQALVRLLNRVVQAGAALQPEFGPLSYFEAITAVGLTHFAELAVDAAVIEVGLGGRLDATNTITPALCLIGAIQLEHTDLLGTTLGAIAREKAGILKPGVPAATVPQAPEALEVIQAVAAEVGAPLVVLGRDAEFTHRLESDGEHGTHVRVSLTSGKTAYEHVAVPLPGEHQAANCGLVLTGLELLSRQGLAVSEAGVVQGLRTTARQGRAEVVSEQPRVLIDGAHTPPSIAALVRALGAHHRYDSLVVVFGCAQDKDVDGMLAEISRGADKIVFTRASDNPRAADPQRLAARFAELTGRAGQVEPTALEALRTAMRAAGKGDMICVTGSFYLAGEAKRIVQERLRGRGPGPA